MWAYRLLACREWQLPCTITFGVRMSLRPLRSEQLLLSAMWQLGSVITSINGFIVYPISAMKLHAVNTFTIKWAFSCFGLGLDEDVLVNVHGLVHCRCVAETCWECWRPWSWKFGLGGTNRAFLLCCTLSLFLPQFCRSFLESVGVLSWVTFFFFFF